MNKKINLNKNGKTDNNLILFILIGIVIVLLVGFNTGLFSISSESSIIRTIPNSVLPGQTFEVTYSTSSTGKWGASIQENITGGCYIDGKTSLKFVMMSDLPNPLIYTVTAPNSGSCTFSGDYKFGSETVKPFSDSIIIISASPTSTNVTTPSTEIPKPKNTSFDITSMWNGFPIYYWIIGVIVLSFIISRIGGKK